VIKLLPCILFENIYINILALQMARHCANCIGTLSLAVVERLTSPSKIALRRSRFVGQSTGDAMSSWLDDSMLPSLLAPPRLARLLRRGICSARNTPHDCAATSDLNITLPAVAARARAADFDR